MNNIFNHPEQHIEPAKPDNLLGLAQDSSTLQGCSPNSLDSLIKRVNQRLEVSKKYVEASHRAQNPTSEFWDRTFDI